MSKQTRNGGPAFPRPGTPGTYATSQEGMTLRDYFAAKAMAGFCAAADPFEVTTLFNGIARCAYEQADAMLRAREQGEPK